MNQSNTSTPPRGSRPHPGWRLLLPAILVSCLPLHAAPPPGRLLAAQCAQCHGTNGQAVSGFESISGKNPFSMFKELREMSRRRPESIMDLQARAYTEAQLRLIANYLATLPPGNSEEIDD